jgi:hypothetical protein
MEDLPTDEERKNSSVVAAALGVPPNSFVPNHGTLPTGTDEEEVDLALAARCLP